MGACVRPVTTLKVVSASPRSRKLTPSRSLSSGSSTGSTMMYKWLTMCARDRDQRLQLAGGGGDAVCRVRRHAIVRALTSSAASLTRGDAAEPCEIA